jgi:Rps23 Pro-64 3,4-dihydroxylase Tpa1-like proline 4-hydroxylase
MHLSRSYLIERRPVFVFDQVLSARSLRNLYQELHLNPYQRNRYARDRAYMEFNCFPSKKFLSKYGLDQKISSLVKTYFPNLQLKLERISAKANLFGDATFPHTDGGNSLVTALLYCNERWNADWGGETIFFYRSLDAAIAISVQPSRLILFEGKIPHRTGVPQKNFLGSRIGLQVRFTGKRLARKNTKLMKLEEQGQIIHL